MFLTLSAVLYWRTALLSIDSSIAYSMRERIIRCSRTTVVVW
jgi:hypothetical protein